MSDQRYCILKENKTPVTITLKIYDELKAGSDFKLYDPKTKEIFEQFKLTSVSNKFGAHKFKTNLNRLNGLKLNYMLVICSENPNNFRGKVELEILQSAMSVKLTSPLSYMLQNVPPCKLGSAEKVTGSLFFVVDKGTDVNPFTGIPQNL